MLPSVASFDITSENGLSYYNSSTAEESRFNVDADGVLTTEQLGSTSNPISRIESEEINASGTITADQIEATGSLRTERVNNEVHASEFSGSGLATKVENAINWLRNNVDGKGRIRIAPKDDGTVWEWDKHLTYSITTDSYEGIEIDVDGNVAIEYPGSEWFITVEGSGNRDYFELSGGRWFSSGNASGFIRVQDSFGTKIDPHVVDVSTGGDTSTCVSLENHDRWTEENYISGRMFGGIGIDTKPASVTGGSGTDSFDGTHLDNLHLQCTNINMRLRGGFRHSRVDDPMIFTDADGATGIVLGASNMTTTVFTSVKIENAGGYSNTVGIETTSNFNGALPPTIIDLNYVGIDTKWSANDSYADSFSVIKSDDNSVKIMEWGRLKPSEFTDVAAGRSLFETADSWS